MSTPIAQAQANTAPISTIQGAESDKVQEKSQGFAKHLGVIFQNSFLVPINLGAKTLKLLGKKLPVFQWIKSLFDTPKPKPIRPFQECLAELHKQHMAKTSEALISVRPSSDKWAETLETPDTPARGDEIHQLPETSHLLELSQGWENLGAQITVILAALKKSNRTDKKTFEERVFVKLQHSVKPESIEAKLLQNFQAEVLTTIRTMREQVTVAEEAGRATPSSQKSAPSVEQALQKIITTEVKAAKEAPVAATKEEVTTQITTFFQETNNLHGFSKVVEPIIEDALNTMVEQARTKKATGKPPRHPNIKPQTQLAAKMHEPIVVSKTVQQTQSNTQAALTAMVQKETHEALHLAFSEGTAWNKKGLAQFIFEEIKSKHATEATFSAPLIQQLIHMELAGIKKSPYQFTKTENEISGGYFKKTTATGQRLLPNTLVLGAHGNTYALLNKLTPQDVADIKNKYGIEPTPNEKTVLGQGGFGKVRFARDINSNDIVAVKKVSTQYDFTINPAINNATQDLNVPLAIQERIETGRSAGYELKEFENSFALFQDHAIVKDRPMRDAFSRDRSNHPTELGDKVYIFSELANLGDGEALMPRLHALRTTNQRQAQQLFLNTAVHYTLAVKRLHSLGFHHRDIKPENFLHGTDNGKEFPKLADFGVATDADQNKTPGGGTASFAPPEWFEAKERLTQNPQDNSAVYFADKHDAFSLGVSLQRIRYNLAIKEFDKHLNAAYDTQGDLAPVLASQAFPIRLRDNTGRDKKITVSLISEDQWSYKGLDESDLQDIDMNNLDMSHLDNIMAGLLMSDATKRMSVGDAYEHLANLAKIQRDFSASQQ